jgi:hypothetical protein
MTFNKEEDWDDMDALDKVLNNMINDLQKVRVRFPNEDEYVTLSNFRLQNFESIEEYDKEIYGKYKGEYVMINKEDYFNTIL